MMTVLNQKEVWNGNNYFWKGHTGVKEKRNEACVVFNKCGRVRFHLHVCIRYEMELLKEKASFALAFRTPPWLFFLPLSPEFPPRPSPSRPFPFLRMWGFSFLSRCTKFLFRPWGTFWRWTKLKSEALWNFFISIKICRHSNANSITN